MKKLKAPLIVFFFGISSVMAAISVSFQDWDSLVDKSPDIIVACCKETPQLMAGRHVKDTRGWIESEIQVVAILKGSTNTDTQSMASPGLGDAKLGSEFFPLQGESYLIFSTYNGEEYQATETYRVVPLGLQFSTNYISGSSLKERVRNLIKRRLSDLRRQMEAEAEEKERLEKALQE